MTKAAQLKGSDPLLWAVQMYSNLNSAGEALPSVELAHFLVSYICWDNNVPILWKFLEKALALQIVPPVLLLALLSVRSFSSSCFNLILRNSDFPVLLCSLFVHLFLLHILFLINYSATLLFCRRNYFLLLFCLYFTYWIWLGCSWKIINGCNYEPPVTVIDAVKIIDGAVFALRVDFFIC